MTKDREYELHLMLASLSVKPWEWLTWRQLAKGIEPLLSSVPATPATYSRQSDTSTKRNKSVAFGRMTFGEKADERWTHGSSKTIGRSETWEFADTQIWVPSRNECERERKRPHLYVHLLNGALGHTGPVRFSAIFLLAVATDLPETMRSKADIAMDAIARVLQPKLRAYKIRPWSLPFGLGMRVDSIMDLDTWLFRVGPRHSEDPGLTLLKEEWQAKSGSIVATSCV